MIRRASRSDAPRPRRLAPRLRRLTARWLVAVVSIAGVAATGSFDPSMAAAGVSLLTRTPTWSSAPATTTSDIALGDVDLDGDLDLVCANQGVPSSMFRNDHGKLEDLPAWVRSDGPRADTVTLADIDGDGRLDAIFGGPAGATLHTNTGDAFTPESVWISPGASLVSAVAIGDVDNDGDNDLITGSSVGKFGLYVNDRGTLAETASWEAAHETSVILLGDVDADGRLDLVCSNQDHVRIYRNLGGTFDSTPLWESSRTTSTTSLALGDLDGDGDLDLVHGVLGASVEAFANSGTGDFGAVPFWVSNLRADVRSLDLADLDGDGLLDLVCGVDSSPSIAFRGIPGGLERDPSWIADVFDATDSIALGDLDGDGDPDLVCGNYLQTATAFDNLRAPFMGPPDWGAQGASADVTLGDVDGDGDIDAVFAGSSSRSSDALYRNAGGRFETNPAWRPAEAIASSSVALGDVDGDGDLDLVCGRPQAANVLFRNVGGTFETTPAWSAAAPETTTAVALGDLDGDGDLDLVVATRGRSRAYRNTGGSFEAQPFWRAHELTVGAGCALGRVDGDDAIDLVIGASLYLNHATTGIDTIPTWKSNALETPHDVALGDVDGDGHLDVAFANGPRNNSMYLGVDGLTFGPRTVWYPELADGSTCITLTDVDGDGDLDVVCGAEPGIGARDVIYENHAGHLDAVPVWAATATTIHPGVALGDLDADGDLDLTFASDSVGVARKAIRRPPYLHDPAAPAHQLPNNGAFMRNVRITPESAGVRRIDFTAYDVESDPYWVVAEFQILGARDWQRIQQPQNSPRNLLLGPFRATPSGDAQTFRWDLTRLPIGHVPVAIRLRTVSNPERAGSIQYVADYYADAGVLEVRRPILVTPVDDINLPVVTVGDTVTRVLKLGNSGNEAVRVDSIGVENLANLRFDPAPPLVIEPEASRFINMTYAPREVPILPGRLHVYSNDPANFDAWVGLVDHTKGLQVRTRAMAQVDSVPLGQALTIQVIPDAGVILERALLHYKPNEVSRTFSTLEMLRAAGDTQPDGPRFGIIPGDEVTELGLVYYVEVENSGVIAVDPPGAPSDSFFTQPVARPLGIDAVPQPNSSSGFLAGRIITVQVSVPSGAQFQSGELFYRVGGSANYGVGPLTAGDPFPVGTIPDSVASPRGVEYYVRLHTRTQELTDPASDPAGHPSTLRTRVQNLTEGQHPGQRYRLLSMPLDFGDFSGTLADFVADEPEFGVYDPKRWRAFLYTEGRGNVELLDGRPGMFGPVPGRALWLITRDPHAVDTSPIEGTSTPTSQPFAILLNPGWNPIGDPFAFPVAWSSVRASIALDPPVAFDSQRGAFGDWADVPPSILYPFDGVFLENPTAERETLWVPPVEIQPGPPPVAKPLAAGAWRLRLAARDATGEDAANIVGVDPSATDVRDPLDGREPPPAPGVVQLCIDNASWNDRPGDYRIDVRAPAEGHAWDLEVRRDAAGEVSLVPSAIGDLPADLGLVLVDLEQGSRTDLRAANGALESAHILAYSDRRAYRLRLLAGSQAWIDREAASTTPVPTRFSVLQNAPNPFNGGTRFRFGLPQAAAVTLEIFDVHGRRVRTLAERETLPAGWHTRLWDGTTADSRPAASGVYFFRLRAGDAVETKRMVLVK